MLLSNILPFCLFLHYVFKILAQLKRKTSEIDECMFYRENRLLRISTTSSNLRFGIILTDNANRNSSQDICIK